ncbi:MULTISPECIES: tetratricopeptide repeat protein [Mesorhizobium]|nr:MULTISPECIES: tetratricopeptide repeat protein [Mesorhizobium]
MIERMYQEAIHAFGSRNYTHAESLLKRVVELVPRLPEGHHALGVCYYGQMALDQAARSIRTALSLKEDADFYLNLALVLQAAEDVQGAIDAYRSSLRLNPNSPKALGNLANILGRLKQHEEAIQLYQKAILADPNYVLARSNLAFSLAETGRAAEAIELYQSIGAWGDAQAAMRNNVMWDKLAHAESMYLRELFEKKPTHLASWSALLVNGITPDLERRAAFDCVGSTLNELNAPPLCTATRIELGGCRLRIGYLSSEFYNHATMHLLAGVLECHDPSNVDVRIFSYSPRHEDAFTERLRATKIPFTDISRMTDREAANEIHRQGIDILVDLKGHTQAVRLGITALRPAPIIVNWLGYPGSLGHPRLADYIIGDPTVTPLQDAPFYSERLALMPHCYQPNDHKRELPGEIKRVDIGLPDDALVLCNFNNAVKFNPRMMDLWCRVLKAVPNSVFWFLDQDPAIKRENLNRELRVRGIAPDRIFYSPFAPQSEHTTRMQLADLALDTFPYTSHTTASDTLWAGVPLVTLKGRTFASRVAASLLKTHGFHELVVETDEAYVQLAMELATNHERRNALRASIASARRSSPLFDANRFARDLEALYHAILTDYNLPPAARAATVAAPGLHA